MNRKQRRQSRHRNPHLASRALFEEELRRALRKHDIALVSCSTGQQGDEPRWVLEVRRGETRLFMHSPPKTVEGMVAGILARLDGKDLPVSEITPTQVEQIKVETVQNDEGDSFSTVTGAVKSRPQLPITTKGPGNGPASNVVEHHEDLSHYLDEGLELKRP